MNLWACSTTLCLMLTGCYDTGPQAQPARTDVGRYQLIQFTKGADGTNNGLILDTRDGHLWKWYDVESTKDTQGAVGMFYVGRAKPAASAGTAIARFAYPKSDEPMK